MKKFIQNMLIFLLLTGAYFAINLLINYHRLTDTANINASTLIIGDSHLKTAIDPAGLVEASNVCTGAESYIMSFFKLKKLVQDNPHIKQVLLGFSYNNFSAYQDLRLTGDQAKSQFIRYYEILPIDLPKQVAMNDSKFYHTYIRELALYPNFVESKYLGAFEKHESRLEQEDLMEVINRHYYPEEEYVGISTYAMPYLDSIVQLTKRQEIELILVAAPLHDLYREKVPTEIKDYFLKAKTIMENQDILVLDFLDLELEDDSFKDYDHLSYEGAKQFTTIVSALKNPADNSQQGH